MRFPMLANWLCIQKVGRGYRITNILSGEKFVSTEYGDDAFFEFIQKLDGKTNPYLIPSTYTPQIIAGILNQLKEFDLIREDRWLSKSFGFFAYSLIIPKNKSYRSTIPNIINTLLWLLFLPVTGIGIALFSSVAHHLDKISMVGIILGYVLGIVFHEYGGHAIATMAYGGKVFEYGLSFFVPGAYTMIINDESLSRLKRVQVDAAGIEQNFLLAGISFILARYNYEHIDIYYSIGMVNISLALLNLCNVHDNDGCKILSTLLGIEGNIVDIAKSTVFNTNRRNYLLSKGSVGKTTLCAYYIVLFMQVVSPLLIIANVLGGISWFI